VVVVAVVEVAGCLSVAPIITLSERRMCKRAELSTQP
jgi:hypothetical protein